MYIEKIFFQKLFREDPQAELKTGYRPCTGDELTANQKVKVRVIAVGLDFEKVTKFLESPEGIRGMKYVEAVKNDSEQTTTDETKEGAKLFVQTFRDLMNHEDVRTDKQLVQVILDHLQCFGPGKVGSNLLINRYLPVKDSLLAPYCLAQEIETKTQT